MGYREKLLAAALTGAVLGAAGCGASTASQTAGTTPVAASGEKHSCKGEASCNGQHSCKGEASCNGAAANPPDPSAEGGTGE
jgi:hypothetical protein